MLSFRPAAWLIPLARRLLYCWVRTTVLPEKLHELALDPARQVCYVLQDRHFSNVLVLLEESRRAGLPRADAPLGPGAALARSFFFLNRHRPQRGRVRTASASSPLLAALVRRALADSQFDVQLVPVVILWGRAPDKQDSILKALFSETWRPPGAWRQLLAIVLHGRQVLVRYNSPLSLRDFLRPAHGSDMPPRLLDEEQSLRKLARLLRVHFRRQRQMAIGPDLSHRHTQINAVLAGEQVRQAVANEAGETGCALVEAQAKARRFAEEIASDYSYGVVRALELFLTWLWTRLFDGIELHRFEVVTRIAAGQEVVYVPCHRSHIDYLLLSYIVHRHGLTPPHIAAGANLNLPIVGPLLRRGGAFFLRRSFKGEPLYAAVFDQYLHLMLARGFPIEYFIEGGRSRSGRMLSPKAGILGMTVDSFVREHSRPLVFIPVYIGYEKVLEGPAYVRELSGQPKQRESLLGIVKSVRSLKRVFGKVHVNVGEPLALAAFLDQAHFGWREPAIAAPGGLRPLWSPAVTRRAAIELATRINSAAVVNPVNLIGLGLLATPKHISDEPALQRMIAHYQALTCEAPYSAEMVACTLPPQEVIACGERLQIVARFRDALGDLIRIPPGQAPLLAYFRNNVLHVFALPSVLACLLIQNRELEATRVCQAVTGICSLLAPALFLRWQAAEMPAAIESVLHVLVTRGLLRRSPAGERIAAPEPISQEYAELHLLGETMRPLLERHFVVLALLERQGSGRLSRQALEDDCQLLAQRLTLLYECNEPDVPEKATFTSFISTLLDAEFLREDDRGMLHLGEGLLTPMEQAELVLSPQARDAIRRIASRAGALVP